MHAAIVGQDFRNIATGGTITTVTLSGKKYRVHTFSNVGSSSLSVSRGLLPFRALIAAGGGGVGYRGSSNTTGGGGAGGLYTNDAMALATGSHAVTVGAGGSGGYLTFGNGGDSSFSGITRTGGGYGTDYGQAGSGGSGGGGGGNNDYDGVAGSGTSGQGYSGGSGKYGGPGGGGGAGGPGQTGTDRYDPDGCSKGIGGPGVTSNIRGTNEVFCAGGRATVYSVYGGGSYGGCGGVYGNGQQGVVIVAYEVMG